MFLKRIAKGILGYLGYELHRQQRVRSVAYDVVTRGMDLRSYFDKTEGMIAFEEAVLLYELAKSVKESCIVEVGSYRGRSTVALGRGSIDGHGVPVFAIEPHEPFKGVLGGEFGAADRGGFYGAMLMSSCYHVVRLVNLSSEAVAPLWRRPIGLLWIDGDHTYVGVKRDFAAWEPHLAPGAVVAFDDSTDAELGPQRLIRELVATREFEIGRCVGRVMTLVRREGGVAWRGKRDCGR